MTQNKVTSHQVLKLKFFQRDRILQFWKFLQKLLNFPLPFTEEMRLSILSRQCLWTEYIRVKLRQREGRYQKATSWKMLF